MTNRGRHNGEKIALWRGKVLEAMPRSTRGMTEEEIVATFGMPPGGLKPRVAMYWLIKSGQARLTRVGAEKRYQSTGEPALSVAIRGPILPHLGRGFPRAPSIFHLAQGITA